VKVLLIHPAHGFATADVYTGVLAGLRANGVEVVEYRLDIWLDTSHVMVEAVKAARQAGASFPLPDEYAVGAQAAIGYAIWKECTHILVITGQHLHMSVPLTLRKAGIKTALLCTESPYLTVKRERHDAQLYDVVFTHEKRALPLFGHTNVHYLPHAYNADVHMPGDKEAGFKCDAFFCGTGFDERQRLFGGVDWTGIDFRCLGALWHGHQEARHLLIDLLPNEEAVRWYRSAKINLNHHRTTADWSDQSQIATPAESLGPRAYEIAACGGFQLCDDSRQEWWDVFPCPAETSYRAGDPESLERSIRYWLAHDGRREEMALAQHQAVLPHSWQERAKELIGILDGAKTPRRSKRMSGGASLTGGDPHGNPARL
jgi:spore maturation protein CgeB